MTKFFQKKLVLSVWVLCTLMLFVNSTQLYAQTTVTGRVVEANGDALPGVTILKKNTTVGTITDLDGNYTIKAGSEDVLVFSFVGYKTVEEVVGGRTNIDVSLDFDTEQLGEVVVIGYGSQTKEDVSSAISSVSSEDLVKTINPRIEQALQGKVAGVQVTSNSGAPGSGLTVTVRGTGSFNGAAPLYVVDGVILQGGLEFLNSNDVASINVLKDAAAASIYGSRGANGVVLITTKNGSDNGEVGTSINVNAYTGVQALAKTPDLMNAREYATHVRQMYINDENEFNIPVWAENPGQYGVGTDWYDEISGIAPISEINLSAGNTYKTGSYFISGTYFDQEGVIGLDKATFERYNMTFNSKNDITERLEVRNSLTYSHQLRNTVPTNDESGTNPSLSAFSYDPITRVRFGNGDFMATSVNPSENKHPVARLAAIHNANVRDRILGNVKVSLEVIDGLFLQSTTGVEIDRLDIRGWNPLISLRNEFGELETQEAVTQSSVNVNILRFFNRQQEFLGRYKKSIGGKSNLEAALGFSIQSLIFEQTGGSRIDPLTDGIERAYIDNGLNDDSQQISGNVGDEAKYRSLFARAIYDYDNKYFFTASIRSDESSRFGPNNRRGIFPAVSAAWKISEEPFFNSSAIDFLKLRLGWGQNGSDGAAGRNNFLEQIDVETVDGQRSFTIRRVGNPDLKWETSEQLNVGIDLEVLNKKLFFQTDFFIKDTKDLLATLPTSAISGLQTGPFSNIASVRNTGFEFLINYKTSIGDLNLDLGANYSRVANEVTTIGGAQPILSNSIRSFEGGSIARTDAGQPISSFFGFQTDGIFNTQEEIDAYTFTDDDGEEMPITKGGLTPQLGDVKYIDRDGDGQITTDDRDYIGSPIPTDFFAFTANLDYKGFDLYIFLQGAGGNNLVNATVQYQLPLANRPAALTDSWTPDNVNAELPRVTIDDPWGNRSFSDRFIEKGDFLRLKNVSIGYSLPQSLLDKTNLGLSKVRFYVSGQNILTFTGYSGLDPEIGTTQEFANDPKELGVDRGFYPQPRMFIGGVNINF